MDSLQGSENSTFPSERVGVSGLLAGSANFLRGRHTSLATRTYGRIVRAL